MCDIVAGQLIICHPNNDPAAAALLDDIRQQKIEHVSFVDNMQRRLQAVGLKPDPGLEFTLHLLEVPPGQEAWKSNFLQFFYKHKLLEALTDPARQRAMAAVLTRSDYHFLAVPNSVLGLADGAEAPNRGAFVFSEFHAGYRSMIGLRDAGRADGVRVLIADTGVTRKEGITIAQEQNVVNPRQPANDDHGHGTAVASIIGDLAPGANLLSFKVANASGHASEWDALVPFVADLEVDVVNMSLQFGLHDYSCPRCGRQSRSSRSAVYENVIGSFARRRRALVVAAAGNGAGAPLAFPARFQNVVAVASINSAKQLSVFSNRGSHDEAGGEHPNYFVLPGGEDEGVPGRRSEHVGYFEPNAAKLRGTSYAAAYASGLLARLLARLDFRDRERAAVLEHLRETADRDLPDYSRWHHGRGIMRLAAGAA